MSSDPSPSQEVCRWAVLYEPEGLISARSFDFERTARSCLDVAMRVAGAEGGALATLDRGQDLVLVTARGVDPEGVLEDPKLGRLCRLAVDENTPVSREGLSAGPALPRAGGQQNALVFPLRLFLGARPGPLPTDRERRRFPPKDRVKPLGVLVLLCPPGPALGAEVLDALEALSDHASEVLTNARLYHRATRDPLTDLYHRQELEQLLAVELTLARHTNAPLGLVMLDIDDMGRVNQELGRARGDKVIARVARLVRARLRRDDACVRYGGEELALVLPGTDAEGAMSAAEKVRAAVADYPGFGGGMRVTVSCGVAVFPYHAERPAELLRKADQSLFLSKQEGGNRALLWHRRIPKHALRADKLIGIITGNQAKDYRNVMMLLDTIVVVNSLLERKQVLGTLLDMMVQLAHCQRGFLYLERDRVLQLEVALDDQGHDATPDGICQAAIDRVHNQGVPVAFLDDRGRGDDADDDGGSGDQELSESCRALGLERAICLPLHVKGKQLGLLYVDAREQGEEFEESDLIFMKALARELGSAIENTRLYQENVEQKQALEDLTSQLSQKVQAQASELADLQHNLQAFQVRFNYDKIVGKSEAMQKVFKLLDQITDTDVAVLIQGETGTGKELVARALHVNGRRKDGPFVSVNCSAISESLMESELFGHVRGAFTGADVDKQGLFEQAHGGTIFLDEVQDMSPGLQRELLRVLQEGEIRRVGGKDMIKVDVRVVSSANRDLRDLVKRGEFRQDLFYRLNVVPLELPPLRDRKEDIPLLVQRFLDDARTADGRRLKLDKEALRAALAYDWPGNIRQLQNWLEKTVLLIDGDTIRAEHVRFEGERGGGAPGVSRLFESEYNEAKQAFAREYLKSVLARNSGNVTKASAEAGIVRSSFHKMMRKHGISAKDFGAAKQVTRD
jgi:diguanylate cyclase (GGDEF)-like protein